MAKEGGAKTVIGGKKDISQQYCGIVGAQAISPPWTLKPKYTRHFFPAFWHADSTFVDYALEEQYPCPS
jgi:hypothetical protein